MSSYKSLNRSYWTQLKTFMSICLSLKLAEIFRKSIKMNKRISFLLTFIFCCHISLAQSNIKQINIQKSVVQDGFFIYKINIQNYEKPYLKLSNLIFEEAQTNQKVSAFDQIEPIVILGKEKKQPFALVYIPVYKTEGNFVRALKSLQLEWIEKENDKQFVQKSTAVTNSVLADGNWYKIEITKEGIYKIDYNFIQNKLGVNPSTINTNNISLFGNGGAQISQSNADSFFDDLIENKIKVVDGGDGIFNQEDYILFYAQGSNSWTKDSLGKKFYHVKNIYEDKSYYFINFNRPNSKRVNSESGNIASNIVVSSSNQFAMINEDILNIGRFGKTWWGDEFSSDPGKSTSKNYTFNTGLLTDSVIARIHFGVRSSVGNNLVNILLNNNLINSTNYGSVGTSVEDNPLVDNYLTNASLVSGSSVTYSINFQPGISSARGYLDYLELNWRSALNFANGFYSFRDWNSVGVGNVAKFTINSANNNLQIWDITQPLEPIQINGTFNNNEYTFSRDASLLRNYIAFDGSNFSTPDFVQKIDNQNLHGSAQMDYIIVTHKNFLNAAEKLANFHRTKNNLKVIVATTDQIYNEFSSGSQDIGAIRNFARMFYDRAGNDTNLMPKYLLLLGDASFDYKDRIANNTNFVPTYETTESINLIDGYCSDDYFSFLDDNEDIENWGIANTMDLGVGRLPVATADAALKVVDKIINYAQPKTLGPWRINTTVIADNGDGEQHFMDGETMAATIEKNTNIYNENKIYLSVLPTISTPGGMRAPEANKAINDAIFNGTFLVNYNGHGSITTLAHERILTQDDFNNWKNADMLPIMITATCDFSKYDDPAYVSAGEKLAIKADGGAIALLTTTQLVYAHLNRPMNTQYLDATFKNYTGTLPTLGDAFRISKNQTYSSPKDKWTLSNYRKFVLLGDPALHPAYPTNRVLTTELLDGNTGEPIDTIKALGKYIIKGKVVDKDGAMLPNFNGKINITLFDKKKTVALGSSLGLSFKVQNNIIFKGKVSVTNGEFSCEFITPKDINYEFGKGKISYYAENGLIDAAGADTNLLVGGFSDNPNIEDNAPIVKPYMNDSLFQDGGITGANSILFVSFYDETGINVSGNSIGHDITAVLDNQFESPYILNDYYQTAPNDYKNGYVRFPITGLSDGSHSISVKAWDMNNNSGEGKVYFEVVNGKILAIKNLMNYPNPFNQTTTFVFDHNHPNEEINITILIYNTNGSFVTSINKTFSPTGSKTNEITWEGTTNNGSQLPSGMYAYKINIKTSTGIEETAYQKLVIIR